MVKAYLAAAATPGFRVIALILTVVGFLVLMSVPFFTVADSIGKPVPAIGGTAVPEHSGH